jgi:hypothetical protein
MTQARWGRLCFHGFQALGEEMEHLIDLIGFDDQGTASACSVGLVRECRWNSASRASVEFGLRFNTLKGPLCVGSGQAQIGHANLVRPTCPRQGSGKTAICGCETHIDALARTDSQDECANYLKSSGDVAV